MNKTKNCVKVREKQIPISKCKIRIICYYRGMIVTRINRQTKEYEAYEYSGRLDFTKEICCEEQNEKEFGYICINIISFISLNSKCIIFLILKFFV